MASADKLPTRIYTFGLLPPKSGGEALHRMLRASCHYYNALLEIELWKRKETAKFWAQRGGYSDKLEQLETLNDSVRKTPDDAKPVLYSQIKELELHIRELREAVTMKSLPKEEARRREREKEIKADFKSRKIVLSKSRLMDLLDLEPDCVSPRRRFQLNFSVDSEKRGVKPSGKLLNKLLKEANLIKTTQHIDDQVSIDIERAKKYYGLYYGTYALIDDAVDQALRTSDTFPAFKRWTGEGRVGSPVSTNEGLNVSSVHDCSFENGTWADKGNTVLQIVKIPDEVWEQKTSREKGVDGEPNSSWVRKTRTNMRICVDSLGRANRGRLPVWVEFPIVIHRPLPKNGKIVGAWVSIFMRGNRTKYELQLQVQDETHLHPKKPHGDGTVAFNFGYRSTGRVAYTLDDTNFAQEMTVDPKVEKKIDLADKRRQSRELAANEMRDSILKWSKDCIFPDSFSRNDGKKIIIPHWSGEESRARSYNERSLRKKIELLPLAKDESLSNRLHSVHNEWKFVLAMDSLLSFFCGPNSLVRPEDKIIFEELNTWTFDDKSIQNHEAGSRFKSRKIRQNQIHVWAHEICDNNSTILIENTNYAKIKRVAKDNRGSVPVEVITSISRRRDAYAPGNTRKIIEEVAKARGLEVKKINPANLTRIHHACGHDAPWDASVSIEHECEKCRVEFDQDRNFCEGMLIRSKT